MGKWDGIGVNKKETTCNFKIDVDNKDFDSLFDYVLKLKNFNVIAYNRRESGIYIYQKLEIIW